MALLAAPVLCMEHDGNVQTQEGISYRTDALSNTVVSYDNVDWESVGEERTMELLCQSYLQSNGSAVATLRMFDSAVKGFSANSPEVAERLSAALEVRVEVLLAKHLEGIGMTVSEYREHTADFRDGAARHLSDFAGWRYRSIIDDFPNALRQVLNLTIHHLTASPERVRAQIAANNR
jgi:hypothetical protein